MVSSDPPTAVTRFTGNLYICGTYTDADSYARKATNLAYYFDEGLKNPQVWDKYCGEIWV